MTLVARARYAEVEEGSGEVDGPVGRGGPTAAEADGAKSAARRGRHTTTGASAVRLPRAFAP
jgi:hypothetical protein